MYSDKLITIKKLTPGLANVTMQGNHCRVKYSLKEMSIIHSCMGNVYFHSSHLVGQWQELESKVSKFEF